MLRPEYGTGRHQAKSFACNALDAFFEPGVHHPDRLFLFRNKVADHGIRSFVSDITGLHENAALDFQKGAQRIDDELYGFFIFRDVASHLELIVLYIIFKRMQWRSSYSEYALGYHVDLELGIVVQLFEFNVQIEEALAADVPVNAAQVLVIGLKVGEKDIEIVDKSGRFFDGQS